jgi:hypothetical protein
MTVAINPVQPRQDDSLGTILNAINVATNIYNAKLDRNRQDAMYQLQQKKFDADQQSAAATTQREASKDVSEQALKFRKKGPQDPGGVKMPALAKAYGEDENTLFVPLTIDESQRKQQETSAKIEKDKQDANKEKAPKMMTSVEAANLGGLDGVDKAIDSLYEDYKKRASATGSGIASLIPGSEPNKYNTGRQVAAKTIGTVLEQGKNTDKDTEQYYSMLPGPGDTNEKALAKVEALKKFARIKMQAQIQGLGKAGFDTSSFGDANSQNQDQELNALLQEKQRREALKAKK